MTPHYNISLTIEGKKGEIKIPYEEYIYVEYENETEYREIG